jgi:hypothetical protein
VQLAWDESLDADIDSYRIHYGTSSSAYTQVTNAGLSTNIVVTGLSTGITYYFAATAIGTNGLESVFSNEISYTVPSIPLTNDYPPVLGFIDDVKLLDGVTSHQIPIVITDQDVPPNPVTVSFIYTNLIVNHSYINDTLILNFNQGPVGSADVIVNADDGKFLVSQTFNVSIEPWLHISRGSPTQHQQWVENVEIEGELYTGFLTNYFYTNVVISWPQYKTAFLQYKTDLNGNWIGSPTWTNNPANFNIQQTPVAFFRISETNFPNLYLVQENFENVGYELNWNQQGNANFNPDYTTTVLNGNESLNINANSQFGRIVHIMSQSQDEVYFYCLFRMNNTLQPRWIANFTDGSANLCQLRILATGRLFVRAGSSGGVSTLGTISPNETYHIWGHYIKGNGSDAFGSIAFSTDGIKPNTGQNYSEHINGDSIVNVSELVLGDAIGVGNGDFDFIWDKVIVSNTPIGDSP